MSCIFAHGLEQRDFVEFERALYQSVTKEKKEEKNSIKKNPQTIQEDATSL